MGLIIHKKSAIKAMAALNECRQRVNSTGSFRYRNVQ
jgi:hypothetical protein